MSDTELRTAAQRRNSTPANPLHAQLWRELGAVLDSVQRVQDSWALVEPGLEAHALAFLHAFLARCPAALQLVRSKQGLLLSDPAMLPIMLAHQRRLLQLVGTCVAGQRDLAALAPTLVATGRMHARFGDTIREFVAPCGAALLDTVRGALGESCTPDVERAWAGAMCFVRKHMLRGIDQVQRAAAAEHGLADALLGQPPAVAAAAH
jgi:hypothetical protein